MRCVIYRCIRCDGIRTARTCGSAPRPPVPLAGVCRHPVSGSFLSLWRCCLSMCPASPLLRSSYSSYWVFGWVSFPQCHASEGLCAVNPLVLTAEWSCSVAVPWLCVTAAARGHFGFFWVLAVTGSAVLTV